MDFQTRLPFPESNVKGGQFPVRADELMDCISKKNIDSEVHHVNMMIVGKLPSPNTFPVSIL
jgi:hypothetical protein